MRLTDHLAASRGLYLRALASMPDIMLIDVPACFAGPTLPLGRYYPILLETAAEQAELEAFLDAPREQLVLPDLLDRRPSGSVSECVVIARYPPVLPGWPWVLLCQWPASYTVLAPPGSDLFARGTYTIEVLASRGDLIRMENRLRATLTGHHLRHISDGASDIGHA
ncbi:hypothetical protein [Novosphingobium sp. KACC 22771]|uniref:hypothetical protein n=1 Tax=Novosphingobium sp. KACC 22771 TaxID=3025670 RepID=UPI0023673B7B|nr:hypothetical protein [Novosphingobium sp. KACC 22771]WDF75241.1 hypothetical protein PQ467_19695 [Novosphingobium sp. KACC 22771]